MVDRDFDTSLRKNTLQQVWKINKADLLVGIPCLNCEETINGVIKAVSRGLREYYPDCKPVIFISDSGSTDDSREVAETQEIEPWQEKIVSIFRGPRGKGSAIRQICEAAKILEPEAVVTVDSDLRSIEPDWIPSLLSPVLDEEIDYVTPLYKRDKLDATITNNVVYPMIRSLYGKRIRQPIGGDFAFTGDLAEYYAEQDVWNTDVARFGIDTWMTVSAILEGADIGQTHLGLKIHDPKDPGESLGPMFRQVFSTLTMLISQTYETWNSIEGSIKVSTFGEETEEEPESISVNQQNLIKKFKHGFKNFSPTWKRVFTESTFEGIRGLLGEAISDFKVPTELWIKSLYEISAVINTWESHQNKLIEITSPLYFAKVGSWVNECRDLTNGEAEELIQQQAREFETLKPYLLDRWKEC